MGNVKVHFIWLGSETPAAIKQTITNWESKANTEASIVTSFNRDEDSIDLLVKQQKPWAQIADVLRLTLFNESNGWYLDVDCEPGKLPIKPLQKTTLFRTEPNLLGNQIFFATENSPFLEIWKRQVRLGLQMRGCSIAEATGPGALTRAVFQYSLENGIQGSLADIDLAGPKYFLHWPGHLVPALKWLPKKMHEGKFATHYAHGSWLETSTIELGPISGVLRATVWRLRNSQLETIFQTMRFILSTRIPLRFRFSRAALVGVNRIAFHQIADIKNLEELVASVTSRDSLEKAVVALEKAFIRCQSESLDRDLVRAGWVRREIWPIGLVWVRPRLVKILGQAKI